MSDTQNDANATPASGESRQLGIVKWFNNKAGFGFVTTMGDEGKDVFVHHSGVSVNREQYKYLVQGEYVEFNLSKSESDSHEWQATNVTGVHRGPLMCETRFLSKQERIDKYGDSEDNHQERRNVRARGSGPRGAGQRGGGQRDNRRPNRNQRWNMEDSSNSTPHSE
tara:strand:- start:421 stop:921 length:501 start_codon:yes stop_codon:yes gene_type:complete